jgi:hypothetical protein
MATYPPTTCPNCEGKIEYYKKDKPECDLCGPMELRNCADCKKSFIAFPGLQRILQTSAAMGGLWSGRKNWWYNACPQCRSKKGNPVSEWETLSTRIKDYSVDYLEFMGISPNLSKTVKSSKKTPDLMVYSHS